MSTQSQDAPVLFFHTTDGSVIQLGAVERFVPIGKNPTVYDVYVLGRETAVGQIDADLMWNILSVAESVATDALQRQIVSRSSEESH